MTSDKKKKPQGMRAKIRQEKKKEERMASMLGIAILIAMIIVSGFFVNSMLNQPTTQKASPASETKAAIVNQASLSPAGGHSQIFVENATNVLTRAGFQVDCIKGEDVTVEFFRNLPTHAYGLIILRVHSGAVALQGKEFVEAPVSFFTSENYTQDKYVWEQLTEQLVIASYAMPQPPYYFGITPNFVTSSMKGRFQNTIIIMTGCEGLANTKMAEAFIQKGAKVYIGWNKTVFFPHTDTATLNLLQHLLTENKTVRQAVESTMIDVGPDPADNSTLIYYPLEAGNYTILNIAGNLAAGNVEIQYNTCPKRGNSTTSKHRHFACSHSCMF